MKPFCLTFLFLFLSVAPVQAGNAEAFFSAVRNGNSKRVEEMVAKDKTLVFTVDKRGMTPFLVAVETRNLKMVSLLSEYFSRLGNTAAPGNALHIAVTNDDEPMVRLLVQLTSEEDSELPKYLINMPRQKNNSAVNDRNTPLHLAAKRCNFSIYQYLLKNGANPDMRNAMGKTPKQLLSVCPKPEAKEEPEISNTVPNARPVHVPEPEAPPLGFPVN